MERKKNVILFAEWLLRDKKADKPYTKFKHLSGCYYLHEMKHSSIASFLQW